MVTRPENDPRAHFAGKADPAGSPSLGEKVKNKNK